jgi:urate oxidase
VTTRDATPLRVDQLFEGAPRFLARLEAAGPYPSDIDFFAQARAIAHTMPEAEQLELIDAHPRLGAPPGSVSAMSYAEQGYDRGTGTPVDVAAELERLNDAYEARFGFRYTVFVAGRSREALLPGMAAALDADRDAEIHRALDAVVDIAIDRHAKLSSKPRDDAAHGGPHMIELAANRYGKAAIRIVRVGRDTTPHALRDVTVAIALEGEFAAAHTDGDNSMVVATDTMKNTAYAFAAEHLTGAIEDYAAVLGRHFLDQDQVDRAIVNVREHAWQPIDVAGTPAPDAFVRSGEGTRVATVAVGRDEVVVEAGIEDLVVMKTTRSAFSGFPRDRFTTLAETEDRLMATKITAIWRYGAPDLDFDASWAAARATLMEVFADHDSPSVQTSIWMMAKAMLERHEELDEVRMVLPNLHHWTVDLAQFGIDNDRLVYISTTEPHGLIEATVRRSEVS